MGNETEADTVVGGDDGADDVDNDDGNDILWFLDKSFFSLSTVSKRHEAALVRPLVCLGAAYFVVVLCRCRGYFVDAVT